MVSNVADASADTLQLVGGDAAGAPRAWEFQVPRTTAARRDFQFKFTRGDWATVEVADDGADIANRTLEGLDPAKADEIRLVLHGFADQRGTRWQASGPRADGPTVTGHLDVFTAHMESLRSGHEARLVQARQIDGWMHEGASEDLPAPSSRIAAVFAGDTNLRAREWEMLAPTFRSQDAFEVAGRPEHARATWSPGGSSPRAYRFDRIWLAQPAASSEAAARRWFPLEFQTRQAKNASDHAGVEVLLREIPAGSP